MDASALDWVRAHLTGDPEVVALRVRPWASVARVVAGGGVFWFKACGTVQAPEARLSAELFRRWPDRVGEVVAHDEDRGWLLLADAGEQLGDRGAAPGPWLDVLPRYAELQLGEIPHAADHLAHGVADRRPAGLPAQYEALLGYDLPVGPEALARLRAFVPHLARLCEDLAGRGVPASVQHDDLHMNNVFVRAGRARVLDWGDSCVGHPFASLVVTFRFLEERGGLAPDDPWFGRLADAYLEPWGPGHRGTAALALRVGRFAQAISWLRHREAMSSADRAGFDVEYARVLHRCAEVTR